MVFRDAFMRTRRISGMAWRQRWPDHVEELCSRVTLKAWSISTRWCPCWRDWENIGTQRDRAGNRQLFYDQYVCLLLLYFFSPTITSLRTAAASTLEAVQRRLGIRTTSLGSFSEPRGCLTPRPCTKSSRNWGKARAGQWTRPRQLLDLTAVDGSIFARFLAWHGPCGKTPNIAASSCTCTSTSLRNSPGCFHYPRLWLGNGSAAGHAAAGTPVRH